MESYDLITTGFIIRDLGNEIKQKNLEINHRKEKWIRNKNIPFLYSMFLLNL